MKIIKKFNEWCSGYGDEYQSSWSGSSWSTKNPEVPYIPTEVQIPQNQSYPYECNKCKLVYFFIEKDGDAICPNCKSDSKTPIPLSKVNI